jgi:cytochrome c oxidase cbb3-type subunit 2
MPSFAFLRERALDLSLASRRLDVQRRLGTPYTDAQVAGAADDARAQMARVAESLRRDGVPLSEVQARSEALALIAYLQSLGRAVRQAPVATVRLEAER